MMVCLIGDPLLRIGQAGLTVTKPVTSTFTPLALTNIAFWYDASQLGLTNGALIDTWNDLSGNSLTLTQGNSAGRPTHTTGVQNSLAIARFDGGDSITRPTVDLSATAAMTVFAVAKVSSLASARGIVTHGSAASPAWELAVSATTGTFLVQGFGNVGTAQFTDAALGTTLFHTLSGIIDYSQATNEAQAWTDAAQTGSVTINSNNTNTAFSSTNTLALGQRQNGGIIFAGDIGEVIGYARRLTTPERQQVEAYLKAKWGTP